MAVKIGHASIDENGKARGGKAGDQTGRELCSRTWWNNSWNKLIRPKKKTVAKKIVKACIDAIENEKIGYDQSQRTTLYTQAQKVDFDLAKIKTACETDCSALVAVCVNAAGVKVSKDIYTGNMATALKNTGEFDVYTTSKYLNTSDNLKAGDILVKEYGHTVIVLTDGATTEKKAQGSYILPTIRKGDEGKAVKIWQTILDVKVDGVFGAKTCTKTRKFQKDNGLEVDGIVGEKTWKAGLKSVQ